jgi:hypothetical protein
VTSFDPYVYTVPNPRSGAAMPTGPAPQAPVRAPDQKVSVVTPICREVDLATISGEVDPPVAGTLYTFDYFLCHAVDATIQRVFVSAESAVAQSPSLALALIARSGQEVADLTGDRVYTATPLETDVIEDAFPPFSGALFLRVRGTSQTSRLFITIELLSSKVI